MHSLFNCSSYPSNRAFLKRMKNKKGASIIIHSIDVQIIQKYIKNEIIFKKKEGFPLFKYFSLFFSNEEENLSKCF